MPSVSASARSSTVADTVSLAGRRIFLTGATGFVGRTLLDHVAAFADGCGDFEICGLSRDPSAFLARFPAYARLDWLTLRRTPGKNLMSKKARVAILGTGNICTDLLIKLMRSESLECTLFVGRNFRSDGMQKASNLGVNISDRGLDGIVAQADDIVIVFDATSAAAHLEHWPVLQRLGKTVIDMTPAKVGELCVPAINSKQILASGAQNVNMITYGGQASVPIANAIAAVQDDIDYIEVASSIASRSAGLATRQPRIEGAR